MGFQNGKSAWTTGSSPVVTSEWSAKLGRKKMRRGNNRPHPEELGA
jgi:hypothetical protein